MTTMSIKPSSAYLAMADSVTVADLPPGYDAYLGYVDGRWPTAAELRAVFPAARLILLTVTGTSLRADGVDVEPGNVDAAKAVQWAEQKIADNPGFRPVIYASVQGAAGYGMGDVLRALSGSGIDRYQLRLLSAHYGDGPHVCGPHSCGLIGTEMDGTQWTAQFKCPGGANVDMSMLADDFFGRPESETVRLVRELGIVRQGDTGAAVKTVQGLLVARGWLVAVDGTFGPDTKLAVHRLQAAGKVTADGVVGPATWPVLLGVA